MSLPKPDGRRPRGANAEAVERRLMVPLQDVRERLADIKMPGAFATRRTSPAGDLRLEVKGVGPIALPIADAAARRLSAIARPARYGLKDQTRLDPRVRDTGEIAKIRVKIDERRWARTLRPMLDHVRRDLGLPDGVQLMAELHNMLVYGPGQFFASHRDSEKTDDMIGTLVVILPSLFTGGAIVLEHHDEQVKFRGSGRHLTFIAFYADCHHRVRPVTTGHRIVLIYNLMIQGDASTAGALVPRGDTDALARSTQDYFDTPRPPRWSGDSRRELPDRLVYLLDHQYTRRSLAWSRLKNTDAARAAALRAVARRLDCEVVLTLADVHESWSCEDEDGMYRGYGRRRWRRQFDEPEDDEVYARCAISIADMNQVRDPCDVLLHDAAGELTNLIAGSHRCANVSSSDRSTSGT